MERRTKTGKGVEITSTGGLPLGLSKKAFFEGRSLPKKIIELVKNNQGHI